MKFPPKLISLLAGASLVAASLLNAVETDPVGYVSFTAADDSDLLVGVPLTQSPAFSASVDSVSSGQVNFTSTVPDLTTEAHFLMVTTDGDPLEGQWFTVTASDSSSVTVDEDLADLGLASGDTVRAFPFWTLDTLFPNGGDIPQSSNVTDPEATIIMNDVTATGVNLGIDTAYLYHDGSQGPEGWYDTGNLGGGLAGDRVISPETFFTIRNRSGSSVSITMSGSVPVEPVANQIVSSSSTRQDNQISNPFPSSFSLGNSNLVSSGAFTASPDVVDPEDRLLVYSTEGNSLRPSPAVVFIYHDGSQGPAGWYDLGDLGAGVQDDFEIPAGAALIVRKAVGSDVAVAWSPQLPYSL